MRLARQGATLEGAVSLASMHRLGEYLSGKPGDAVVVCQFGLGEGNIGYLRGRVQAQLAVNCQRCLESMPLHVDTEFAFGLVESEAQADRLGDQYEALLVGDEPLRLAELIEDELILALPIVALHDKTECPAADKLAATDPQVQHRDEGANPFAVLKELKKH